MADYNSPNQLTLEVGKPFRVNLLSIARASSQAGAPFVYRSGIEDRLGWQVLDAVTEEELWNSVHVDAEGRDLVLIARNTDNALVRIRFWDFDSPDDIVILTCAVIPARRGTVPVPVNEETGAPVEDAVPPPPGGETLRIADMTAWGVGDRIRLPGVNSPFFDVRPAAAVVDANDLDPAVRVTPAGDRVSVIKTLAAGSRGTAVTYGNYTFRILPLPPLLPEYDETADVNLSADTIYLAPGAQLAIWPSSVLDAIPAQYKESLALGAMTFDVLQGDGAPCTVQTGSGNTFPRIILGTTAAMRMPSRNNTISIAIRDTSTLTTRYALRFYLKVLRPDGTDPQNVPESFVDVPLRNPAFGPGASPIPTERPGEPTGFTRTAHSSTSVTYGWQATPGATGYDIYIDEAATRPLRTTAPTFSVGEVTAAERTGLTARRTYYGWLRAKNTAGVSAWVGPVRLDTPAATTTAPVAPPSLTGNAISDTEIVYTFAHTDPRATGYDFFFGTSSTAPTAQTRPTGQLSGTITGRFVRTGLTAGTTYYCWIRATSANGNSGWRGADPVTTLARPSLPAVPTNFQRYTSTATSITYTWDGLAGLSYEFYIATTETAPTAQTTPSATVTPPAGYAGTITYWRSGLTEDQEYYAYIRARNSAGRSAWSSPVITSATAPVVLAGGNAPNLPPAETPLYRNAVFPPPLRGDVLILRRYEGELPERLPQENIAIIAGKIEQEGTETTLGMGDARRVESVVPEILSGGIYDVPKSLSDDFWVEWPHNLPQEG